MTNRKKQDRAKQFIPFDALKGFREALKEQEKRVADRKELSETDAEELNRKLLEVKKNDQVKVIFFENGEYLEAKGAVSSLDLTMKRIRIVRKWIRFEDIFGLEIEKR